MSTKSDERIVRATIQKLSLSGGIKLEGLKKALWERMTPETVRECVAVLLLRDSIYYDSRQYLLARNNK